MSLSSSLWSLPLLLAGGLLLTGCDRLFDDGGSGADNHLLTAARSRRDNYDFHGAVGLLEKAIEANPRLARAHWELGLIYSGDLKDHAAAIYHLRRLLKLAPDWKQADQAQQIIESALLELAKLAPFGPDTVDGQRMISNWTAELHKLSTEVGELRRRGTNLTSQVAALTQTNSQLAYENAQWRERVLRLQGEVTRSSSATLLPPATAGPAVPNPRPTPGPASPAPAGPSTASVPSGARSAQRTPPVMAASVERRQVYQVKRGDTLASIGRAYRIGLRDLIAANPQLQPDRLKPGDLVRIP
ncbi:MAG: LysM peptidoglycan-binding domain-containing protein [Limisphaerales bacterium]